MVMLADRSTELQPDFLSEVVLYALSLADLTMLVALLFVLARNIVKLLVERRRGLPFARFRAKLVFAMLGLTIVPSLLVLLVGGELIRSSTERWFSPPIDEVLRSANAIASDYYREHELATTADARRIARAMPVAALAAGNVQAVRAAIEPDVAQQRVALVEVYRYRAGRHRSRHRRGRIAVAAARPRARVGRSARGPRRGRQLGRRGPRSARGRRRARARRRDRARRRRAPGRRRDRERLPAGRQWRSFRGASRTPTRNPASSASSSGPSRACTCRCS